MRFMKGKFIEFKTHIVIKFYASFLKIFKIFGMIKEKGNCQKYLSFFYLFKNKIEFSARRHSP